MCEQQNYEGIRTKAHRQRSMSAGGNADRSGRTQCQAKKTGNIKQTTAWAKQEHEEKKKEEEQNSLPQRVEAKGNGALEVKNTS